MMCPLHVYKASAGSGKTYALTLEYLKLLLASGEMHRHILAVTFTNKAAREMKQRILERLHALSGDSTARPVPEMAALVETTGMDRGAIRERSAELLHQILNDFSAFSVGTIDKFFQSVIRTFTREIGIQPGYNLELDNDRVLSLAVDQLFQQVTVDLRLQEWLIRFARDQLEEARSWNLRGDMVALGQQLFQESFQQMFTGLDLSSLDKENLDRYLEDLEDAEGSTREKLARTGREALDALDANGLNITDFRGKSRSPASLFETAAAGGDIQFTESRIAAIEQPGKWLHKNASDALAGFTSAVLLPLYERLYEYQLVLNTILVIRRHLYQMGILSDIWDAVERYTRERNLFLISDSSRFLRGILGENQVPFIYERTGNRFHHLMLDEFQDTSVFQYENFIPLLENSLASGSDCLAVGDVKQSIYRWRNSDWQILASRLEDDFRHLGCHAHTLETNYRSREMIVRFNNTLFQNAEAILADEIAAEWSGPAGRLEATSYREQFRKAYEDVVQKIPAHKRGSGGLVHAEFFEKREGLSFQDQVLKKIPGWIREILDSGTAPGDVAILVRNRKEGKAVAGELLEQARRSGDPQGFRLISSDALLIAHHITVKLLVALLRYLIHPGDELNNALIKELALEAGLIRHLSPGHLFDAETRVESLLPGSLAENRQKLMQLPIFELSETLIDLLGLGGESSDLPYIQAFQDILIDVQRREHLSLTGFLEYWEQLGTRFGISDSENSDAIRILTIHKAKGLQFKAVIVPFCNWEITTDLSKPQVIWCDTTDTPFDRIPRVPVRLSGRIRHTLFAEAYYREMMKGYMDSLNLLYVALTRAEDTLFAGVPVGDPGSLSTTGELVRRALEIPPKRGPAVADLAGSRTGTVLRLGEMPAGRTDAEPDPWKFTSYRVGRRDQRFGIRRRSDEYFVDEDGVFSTKAAYGNMMHMVFSRVYTPEDVPRVLDRLAGEGLVPPGERKRLEDRIMELIGGEEVSGWFRPAAGRIYNERPIICGDGTVLRPDRVILEGEMVTVVDFKFGTQERKNYGDQVSRYLRQLKQMGFRELEGYIWYAELGKVVKVEGR